MLSIIAPVVFEGVGFLAIITALLVLGVHRSRYGSWHVSKKASGLFLLGFLLVVLSYPFPSDFIYPWGLTSVGPSDGPGLPIKNAVSFFAHLPKLERPKTVSRSPSDVGPTVTRTGPNTVDVHLTTREVVSEITPGSYINYWTFNDTVPGPFIHVKEGDTVTLSITNDPTSLNHHNIDLHAVNGPGGGAAVTTVKPGETKTFTFKALNPGLYVYHCAHPNVAVHMAHGMYGLILVEPKEGLPPVDKEFYVAQGEFYTRGPAGKPGLAAFHAGKMLDGNPTYVVFNGVTGERLSTLDVDVGDKVRLYLGNGGVNLISSFHVIGEVFDRVYPEGAIGSAPHANIQSTVIPAGGSSIVEFTVDVPGKYVLVDHALARMDKGAWMIMEAEGSGNPAIFSGVDNAETEDGYGH